MSRPMGIAFITLLFWPISIFGQPTNLQLPYMAGDDWWCSQGWNGGYSHTGDAAWDFNLVGGEDLGYPVLAPLGGRVTFAGRAKRQDGTNSAYGNVVILDYGEGYYGRLAHFQNIIVRNGEFVSQGQVLGFCGGVGVTETQSSPHIHFQTQRTSNPSIRDYTEVEVHYIKDGNELYGYPEPCDCMSGYGDKHYVSMNTRVFDAELISSGGSEVFGTRNDEAGDYHGIHWYFRPYEYSRRYRAGNIPENCYAQAWSGGSYSDCAIVYDALGGGRRAYTIKLGFYHDGNGDGWNDLNGPRSSLGMPITNEYNLESADHRRQDFQTGYLEYVKNRPDGNEVKVFPYTNSVASGWTNHGWDPNFSYLIAMAYERNGCQPVVGSAMGSASREHCRYGGLTSAYYIQRYAGGTNGPGAIFYHPKNAKWNTLATNEAYYLYGKFWEKWQEGSADVYGIPTRDWYMSRDPENWDESTEYKLQNFMLPGDEQHYMILRDGNVEWHSDPPPAPECGTDQGSLLANGSFNGGGCWTIWNLDDAATFSFDGRLQASVQHGAYDAVAVLQLVPLEAGEDYHLSFRAWSSQTCTITAISQNRGPPWQWYGLWQDLELDSQPQQIWENFTATESDPRSRFVLALGKVSGDVWIEGVVLRKTDCRRDPGQLIAAPTFESLDCWGRQHRVGDRFWFENDAEGEQVAAIWSSAPGEFWETQLFQPNLPISRGRKYRLSQTIATDRPMDIWVTIQNQDNEVIGPWDSLRVDGGPVLIESAAFTLAEDRSIEGAKLVYAMGQDVGTCRIGNILLEELHCEFDPGSMIGDGGFDDRDCWTFQHRTGKDRFTVEPDPDGEMAGHMYSSLDSDSVWVTQIRQENLSFRTDKHYYFHAEVMSTTPGGVAHVELVIPTDSEDWNPLYYKHAQPVWNGWFTIDTVLTSPADADNGVLSFAFGNVAGDYWIRNVRLEERDICFCEPPNLVASPDYAKTACWHVSGDVRLENGVARVTRTEDGSDPWSSYLEQDSIVLADRWQYRLSFNGKYVGPGDEDATIDVFLGRGDPRMGKNILEKGGRITLSSSGGPHVLNGFAIESTLESRLVFGLGKQAGIYEISDILLEMIPDDLSQRDKYKQPFSRDAIWSTPIGSEAQYVVAGLGPASAVGIDAIHWIVADEDDPVREIYDDLDGWSTQRCSGEKPTGVYTHVPDDLIVPDVNPPETPNNTAAFLQPGGDTLVQSNALARCETGGDVYGVPPRDEDGENFPNQSIYGDGILGGHGGSLLSSIGGTIRRGELIMTEPIRHVLKVLVNDSLLCRGPGSFRWPAGKSDKNWDPDGNDPLYTGNNPYVCMGSLLAIPESLKKHRVDLVTEVGRKLFDALVGYGAYIVDNAAWNCYYFCAEEGVREEVARYYGHSIDTNQDTPYHRDVNKLFGWLSVIDDNGPNSIGGAGDPIAYQVVELIKPEPPEPEESEPAPTVSAPSLNVVPEGREKVHLMIGVSEACRAEVVVYSVAGRVVTRMSGKVLQEGENDVPWDLKGQDGRRVGSGVYFIRVQTPMGFVQKRHVIIR